MITSNPLPAVVPPNSMRVELPAPKFKLPLIVKLPGEKPGASDALLTVSEPLIVPLPPSVPDANTMFPVKIALWPLAAPSLVEPELWVRPTVSFNVMPLKRVNAPLLAIAPDMLVLEVTFNAPELDTVPVPLKVAPLNCVVPAPENIALPTTFCVPPVSESVEPEATV